MKILKYGTPPQEKLYKGTCYTCKTIVEFAAREGKYHPAIDQRDVDYYSVVCPLCGDSINGYACGN